MGVAGGDFALAGRSGRVVADDLVVWTSIKNGAGLRDLLDAMQCVSPALPAERFHDGPLYA